MKNPITTNNSIQALFLSFFTVIFAWAAIGQSSGGISQAQVQAVLDAIDKACLNKDAAAAVANYASNAVITATVVQNGQTYTNRQSRDEYLHVLDGSLKNTADYSLQHKDVVIEIAPDGRTAQCRFTLIEKWRGNNGGMQEADTKESLSFSLLDGKLLVTKDHSDVAVAAQTGVPEANPSSTSAVQRGLLHAGGGGEVLLHRRAGRRRHRHQERLPRKQRTETVDGPVHARVSGRRQARCGGHRPVWPRSDRRCFQGRPQANGFDDDRRAGRAHQLRGED